ncbi:hypothetical protein J6590_058985, partial [Homalodisca vitripennis]
MGGVATFTLLPPDHRLSNSDDTPRTTGNTGIGFLRTDLQEQDSSAVTHPSSIHPRHRLIWLSCDNS